MKVSKESRDREDKRGTEEGRKGSVSAQHYCLWLRACGIVNVLVLSSWHKVSKLEISQLTEASCDANE